MSTPALRLVIGNKNYSSWSMRPWVLLTHFGIPFEEVMVPFDSFDPTSTFKQRLAAITPVGKVPVLIDGDFAVWDTLAIAEYLAEYQADHAAEHPTSNGQPHPTLWPADRQLRARARSLCAEMHSGFGALRSHCPMNIEASLPDVGQRILAEQPAVTTDLARIQTMWREALASSGGPFLFGNFCIADAYFAPVVARLRTYALPVHADVAAYMDRVWASPGVSAWVAQALAEQTFLDFEEPYRQHR